MSRSPERTEPTWIQRARAARTEAADSRYRYATRCADAACERNFDRVSDARDTDGDIKRIPPMPIQRLILGFTLVADLRFP
jgi:hypothetical protein